MSTITTSAPQFDQGAITVSAGTECLRLGELSEQINRAVQDAETHASAAVKSALRAGELLLAAKGQVEHGQWESWIAQNCTCAVRTAQAYMRLASKWMALPPGEAQRVAELPLRQAISAISTPESAPAAYREKLPHFRQHEVRQKLQQASRALGTVASDVGLRAVKRDRLRSLEAKLSAALVEVQKMLEKAV